MISPRSCALTLLLVGCSSRSPTASRHLAITHGTPDSADPAVAALLVLPSSCGSVAQVYCSATLVAPRTLLTAKHCLQPVTTMQVFFGADISGTGVTVGVTATYPHPDAQVDLALVALAAPVETPPVPLASQPLDASFVGSAARVVGFGADDNGMLGVKRTGNATVDAVNAADFRIAPAPGLSCGGDSGGPVLLTIAGSEQLAGVTAYGDPECQISGTNERVDVQQSWIGDTLAAIAALPPASARAPLDPRSDFCSRGCVSDGDCPNQTSCVMGACGLAGMAAGNFAEKCTGLPSDCGGGLCATVPDGCRCYVPCGSQRSTGGCSFVGF